MARYPLLDLWTDEVGDVAVGVNGDLLVARNGDVVAQEVLWRAKTYPGDWVLEPACGAGLEDLIGLPNTRETGLLLEERLYEALTHDGFLTAELGAIQAFPLSREALAALIPVEYGEESFSVSVTLDLKQGVLR